MVDNIETTGAASETKIQSPTKRKAEIAGFPNGVRPVKRRAAKACQTCRSRKVRCDVVDSGPPCNNCRLDQIQCVVSDSRRKRKPRCNGEDEQSPVSSIADTHVVGLKSPTSEDNTLDQSSPSDYTDGFSLDPSAGNSFELELDHHVPHMLYRTQGHRLNKEERIRRISLNSESTSTSQCTPLGASWGLPTLFSPCIRPLTPSRTPKEIEELRQEGSLLIHLLHTKSDDEVQKKACTDRYQQYMEVLQRLRDIKASADSAISFLQASFNRTDLPITMSAQASEVRLEKAKDHHATVLTPPPESYASGLLAQSTLPSEELKVIRREPPPASDKTDECAYSVGTALTEDSNSITIGDVGFDDDFDALFNLDADVDFLAAEGYERTNAHDLHPCPEWKTPEAPIACETKCSFIQQKMHVDQIAVEA